MTEQIYQESGSGVGRVGLHLRSVGCQWVPGHESPQSHHHIMAEPGVELLKCLVIFVLCSGFHDSWIRRSVQETHHYFPDQLMTMKQLWFWCYWHSLNNLWNTNRGILWKATTDGKFLTRCLIVVSKPVAETSTASTDAALEARVPGHPPG